MVSAPIRVRVRMYQVGFGDCILVSIEYDEPLPDGRSARHLLFDYGTTRTPREGRASGSMADVAKLLESHTGGALDVLAVTHRHKDHVFGFGVDAGAKVLRGLAPKRVLRSWTEDPTLPADADGPAALRAAAALEAKAAKGAKGKAAKDADTAPAGPGPASAKFARLMSAAQEQASVLASLTGLHEDVQAAAREQIKNAAAIDLLNELSQDSRGRYLYAGVDAGIDDVVPGLTVTVLGPPTVEQDPRVAKQRADDPEYWMAALHASLSEAAGTAPDPDRDDTPIKLGPGPVRALVEQLASQKSHSVARLVRDLDDALNNTSLLLLLEVGGVSMLFPGDAQIENWQFTLGRLATDAELKAKLAGIDLYKVGHHGSRNATPRSLHALWIDRPDDEPKLVSLLSTQPEVHGKTEATRVPRATLVTALQQVSDLFSTDDLVAGEPFIEVVAEVAGGGFTRVTA